MAFSLRPRPRTWDAVVEFQTAKQFQVDVTLDPATAGPEVILSEDLKEATWGRPTPPWPPGPLRFDTEPCVLGREGFTSGRHYWEATARGRFWALGVALESAPRHGRVLFHPTEGIWGLQRCEELCVVLTAPSHAALSHVAAVPDGGRVGVLLDCDLGGVSLYAVGRRERLCTLRAAFRGERVFPFFCVLLASIALPPRG